MTRSGDTPAVDPFSSLHTRHAGIKVGTSYAFGLQRQATGRYGAAVQDSYDPHVKLAPEHWIMSAVPRALWECGQALLVIQYLAVTGKISSLAVDLLGQARRSSH